MTDSSHFYRRRLPHYRERDAIYFVTWRLVACIELSMPERDLIAAELHHRHEQRYELYAYVIMNDHVHVLLRILDEEPLEKIIHS
jgi:putative transposase